MALSFHICTGAVLCGPDYHRLDTGRVVAEDRREAGRYRECCLHVEGAPHANGVLFAAYGRGYPPASGVECRNSGDAGKYLCAVGPQRDHDGVLPGAYDPVQPSPDAGRAWLYRGKYAGGAVHFGKACKYHTSADAGFGKAFIRHGRRDRNDRNDKSQRRGKRIF